MKTRHFAGCFLLLMLVTSAFAQASGGNRSGGGGITITTVAGLSNAHSNGVGSVAVVKDGNSASDCTVGGGSTLVMCVYNGTTWGVFSSAGIGYPAGTGLAVVSAGTAWGTTKASPTGTVVGTSDSQALTNKDLTGAGNTFPTSLATLSGSQALTNKDLTGAGNTFPTFNQNTTGSAAKWTTARNLAGNSVDGSGDVPFTNAFIVKGTTDAGLSGAQFLGALATGLLKNTTTTGVLSIAAAADIYGPFTGCTGSSGFFLKDGGTCAAPSGSGTVSGQASGVIPLGTSSTAISNQSHMDDGNTTAGVITSTEPIAITGSSHGVSMPAGTALSGAANTVVYAVDATNGYAEVNENNTGLSRVCTAANGICTASVVNSGTITIPSGNSVLVICSSTCSVPVPVPVLGYQICVKNEAGVSTVITLSALGSSAMYPKADDSGYGTAGTGTMVSSAATGNKVCLIGRDSTHYELGAINASANWTVN